MVGNDIVDRTTTISKNSQQNNSGTVTNEHDKEIHKKRCISPEERQKIIDIQYYNDDADGMYKTNSYIKFKNSMLKPSFYNYSDVYILVKGTITVFGAGAGNVAKVADRTIEQTMFKNCTLSIECKTEISNTQLGKPKKLDVVMPTYNLIE